MHSTLQRLVKAGLKFVHDQQALTFIALERFPNVAVFQVQRVVISQAQRYEWECVDGAVEVLAGLAEFQFLPTVSLALSRGFLK